MVFKVEQFISSWSSVPTETQHDLTRLARGLNAQFDEELRLLEEDGIIDEGYKSFLLHLRNIEEGLLPHMKKKDKDDVSEQRKRSEALKKRKENVDIRDVDNDCNAEEEDDPQYELFLKHLKEHDKSYVLEDEEDCIHMVIKYEGDLDSYKECEPEEEPRRKQNKAPSVVIENIPKKQDPKTLAKDLRHKCGPSNQMHGVENQNQRKHDSLPISSKKRNKAEKVESMQGSRNATVPYPKNYILHQNVKRGGDHDVIMRNGPTVVNGKNNDKRREDERTLPRAMRPKSGFSVQMPGVESQQRSFTSGKSRNETEKEENHLPQNVRLQDDPHLYMHKGHIMVNDNISGVNYLKKQCGRSLDRKMKLKAETSNLMPHLENENQRAPDVHPASAKKIESSALKQSRNETQNVWIEKCSASEFMKARAAKCFMAYKNAEESNFEKGGKGKSYSEVEILDEAACVQKGKSNPFVSSKKFAQSMEVDGVQHIGSSARDEFREKVLNVLKKPYDREEYKRHMEVVRDGSYFDYHSDLEGKLKKYRYNRRKRLTILRGFFFWVQNLTQEGSFKPWLDRECLAVEPPSS